MAARDDDDIARLLREVDATLGNPSSGAGKSVKPGKSRQPVAAEDDDEGGIGELVVSAGIWAGASAAATWLLFIFVPFVGAVSAAWGALVAVFVVLMIRGVRR